MTSRLAEFKVEGLFGLYDHTIPFNLKERITIIIGPNGRGKTVCLKLIEALFRRRFTYFSEVLFRIAEFKFTSGEVIKVERIETTAVQPTDDAITYPLDFTLSAPGKETIHWKATGIDARARRELRRYIPSSWEQMNTDTWVDQTDGEELSVADLAERFHIPPKLIADLQPNFPDGFAQLVASIDCHLIETQRLLVLPSGVIDDDYGEFAPRRRRGPSSRLAIQQKAQKLRAIIRDTLSSYANLSQSYDRSFPLRVFEAQGSATLSQEQLRTALKTLDQRREALMSAGILDTEYKAVTMRGGNIEPGVAMALEIYLGDAIQKLDVFNNLLARLDLFKELIAKRFLDKTLHIARDSGFKCTSTTGRDVPLDKLSSGEQHQLILIFDLLFEVTENSLILIDEPELSLHVAWQKTIIESLTRIISLNAFDVLLATHSPAVVARHFHLAVELGPVDE